MATAQSLFNGGLLRNYLNMNRLGAHERLANWNVDDLLRRSDADIVEALVAVAIRSCPVLRRRDAYLLDPAEVTVMSSAADRHLPHRATEFTLVVPFDGDRMMFTVRPSSFTTTRPRAALADEGLRLFCQPSSQDPIQVKADFDGQLDELDRWLNWSREDVEKHHRLVQAELPRMVARRRAKLLADRELHANIGFPIMRRNDADTHAIPLRRREVTPRPEPVKPTLAQPFEPEPALADADYEAALAVLRNMRNAFERNPSTTGHLNEEQIRDILLVGLNAQFEGKAAGEVFNGAGKTDILIRSGDRNVFIGECKIWKGPKTVTDMLDQLLSYLVWRDTKAALLLFIRDADVSTVATKAVAKIEEHPAYKRRGKQSSDERYDFVVHAFGDAAREIRIALLPFLIAGRREPDAS